VGGEATKLTADEEPTGILLGVNSADVADDEVIYIRKRDGSLEPLDGSKVIHKKATNNGFRLFLEKISILMPFICLRIYLFVCRFSNDCKDSLATLLKVLALQV
jgi:hypothetical protein